MLILSVRLAYASLVPISPVHDEWDHIAANLVQGRGYDFVTTYTGADEADCFAATGSSQMQRDGSILVTESFSSGKGKFAKISGGGNTSVVLLPDGSAGSGTVDWRITY